MYVKDIKDAKRTYTEIFADNYHNIYQIFNSKKVLESPKSQLCKTFSD